METGAFATFSTWENFYVILGSAAAGLTGLQFVVIALMADRRGAGSLHTIDSFATPTIIHFCAALMVSAILTSPWPTLAGAGLAVALTGLAGVAYSAVIVRRIRGEVDYKPVLEDWIWHTVLPIAAYIVLFLAGAFLTRGRAVRRGWDRPPSVVHRDPQRLGRRHLRRYRSSRRSRIQNEVSPCRSCDSRRPVEGGSW